MPHYRTSKFTQKNRGGSSTWLVTFTDLITLMLTFFVMICSLGEPKEEAWNKAMTGLDAYLGKSERGVDNERVIAKMINAVRGLESEQGENLSYLRALLETQLKQSGALDDVLIQEIDERIIISMPTTIFFEKGSAVLGAEGQKVLDYLSVKLSVLDNRLEIYGHADSSPISTEEFPSNWELSLTRAENVAYFLGQNGYNRDIVIQGFAESRVDDILETLDREKREQFSRRIDLVIHQDKN